MRVKSMSALNTFLNLDEKAALYVFEKTFAEALFDPLIIMHYLDQLNSQSLFLSSMKHEQR